MTFPSVSFLSGSNNNNIWCFILSRIVGLQYNFIENEIRNIIIIIITAERGDRGECHIEFPSVTIQNPEEGGNKPPKRRFMN